MHNVKELASVLIERYEKITKSNFGTSELKLQKLMYFLQRQSLAFTGESLFEEDFIGWVHGPVLEDLRFFLEEPSNQGVSDLSETEKYLIDSVIADYGKYSSWELRDKTHEEISWNNSRVGLSEDDRGYVSLKLSDIKKDSEKVRVYDPVYDMYIDEFEDLECGVS